MQPGARGASAHTGRKLVPAEHDRPQRSRERRPERRGVRQGAGTEQLRRRGGAAQRQLEPARRQRRGGPVGARLPQAMQ